MKDIWTYATEHVQQGAHFHIDLENKTLVINRKILINKGNCKEETGLPKTDTATTLSLIESYYEAYKHSIPSERSNAKKRRYFNALPEMKLNNEDMLYGIPRESAQANLELFILLSVINKSIDPEEMFPSGHWFWQSKSDPDLVILKKWIS